MAISNISTKVESYIDDEEFDVFYYDGQKDYKVTDIEVHSDWVNVECGKHRFYVGKSQFKVRISPSIESNVPEDERSLLRG